MTQFKVGDRVRYTHDGYEGTIQGEVKGTSIDVMWDDDGMVEVHVGDLELVEEQPNRTYYEEQDSARDYDQEPPLAPWERELIGSPFEQNVHRHLNKIADILISKNKAYGDSALNPIRAFSKSSRIEQLNVRIDDKISRVQRGTDFEDEDTVRDLIGYLVLRLIAEEGE